MSKFKKLYEHLMNEGDDLSLEELYFLLNLVSLKPQARAKMPDDMKQTLQDKGAIKVDKTGKVKISPAGKNLIKQNGAKYYQGDLTGDDPKYKAQQAKIEAFDKKYGVRGFTFNQSLKHHM